MAYYLQGEVSRELLLDCNLGSQLNTDPIYPAYNNDFDDKGPVPTPGFSTIQTPKGVNRFRFQLQEDMYARKLGLKWAQIPLVVENIPETFTTYLIFTLYYQNRVADEPQVIELCYDFGSSQSPFINTTIMDPQRQAPNFRSQTLILDILNQWMNAITNDMTLLDPRFRNYITGNYTDQRPFFRYDPDYNCVVYGQPKGFWPEVVTNEADPRRNCLLGFDIDLGFSTNPKGNLYWDPAERRANVAQSSLVTPILPEFFRSATRFAAMTLGIGNRPPANLKTTPWDNPGDPPPANNTYSAADTCFLLFRIDTVNLLDLPDNLGAPPVPAYNEAESYIFPLTFFPNGNSPTYLVLHSNLMQSSKIKPMVSIYHTDNPEVYPYSSARFPLGVEHSSTILATIPITAPPGVSPYGSVQFFRHDNKQDFLHEMSPSRFREIEIWLSYPDGTPVTFYNQNPVFSLNIIDNNGPI